LTFYYNQDSNDINQGGNSNLIGGVITSSSGYNTPANVPFIVHGYLSGRSGSSDTVDISSCKSGYIILKAGAYVNGYINKITIS
jgi:hypothetical protein